MVMAIQHCFLTIPSSIFSEWHTYSVTLSVSSLLYINRAIYDLFNCGFFPRWKLLQFFKPSSDLRETLFENVMHDVTHHKDFFLSSEKEIEFQVFMDYWSFRVFLNGSYVCYRKYRKYRILVYRKFKVIFLNMLLHSCCLYNQPILIQVLCCTHTLVNLQSHDSKGLS